MTFLGQVPPERTLLSKNILACLPKGHPLTDTDDDARSS